jgi:hypothetical protein
MASIDTLACAQDCSDSIPVFEFSECAPELLQAQISDIYLANDGYPLTDWTNPSEWATRESNSSTDANAIRHLTVIGSLADPTVTEKRISHRRTIYSPQEFVIAGQIDDNSDTNYDAARATGCNRQYRMWFATLGAKLYGGNNGILVNLRMWEAIVEDELEYSVLKFQVKWKAKFMPLRIDNPMASAEE